MRSCTELVVIEFVIGAAAARICGELDENRDGFHSDARAG